jgi:hypothetical protein
MLVAFSCGAASAVAARICIQKYGKDRDVRLVRYYVADEHPDSDRFMADCERWLGRKVEVTRSEKYADCMAVFRGRRFIKRRIGKITVAPCTTELKQRVSQRYVRDEGVSIQALGYTSEEGGRAARLRRAMPEFRLEFPLIDEGLSKADCFALVRRAGIALPAMYGLGFKSNNCRGCVKAGYGHWRLVKKHFPARFAAFCALEREFSPRLAAEYGIGDGLVLARISGGRAPFLDEMPPGRVDDVETETECGIFCQLADHDIDISGASDADGLVISGGRSA